MIKDYGLVVLIAIAVIALFGRAPSPPDLPEIAPDVALTDLEGRAFSLQDLRGKPVVLNFWAAWCGPCKQEVPAFSSFAKNNPDVAVIGLAVDSGSESAVRRAAKQFGIDYRVAIADTSTVEQYNVSVLPTTVIIDPDGRVKTAHVGVMDEDDLTATVR